MGGGGGLSTKAHAVSVDNPEKGSEWISTKGFIEGGPWQFKGAGRSGERSAELPCRVSVHLTMATA